MRESCPLCARLNTSNQKIFHRDFSGMGELVPFLKYDVYVCEHCGLVYAGNIEESMPLDKYYASISKYERPGWSEQTIVSDQDTQAAKLIAKCALGGSIRNTVLDVGCGAGGMLHELKNLGYNDVYGLEPSEKNALSANIQYGVKVYTGNLGGKIPELCEKNFNVVAMKGVLEHLLDLKESIGYMIDYLLPSGKIFIEVPDIDLFSSHSNLYQEFSVEHVNFFSKNSLTELFRTFGFYLDSFTRSDKYGSIMTLWSRDEKALQKYIETSALLAKEIERKIKAINTPFYIWGAGTHTAMLYQLDIIDDAKVKGVVDMNPNYIGKLCYGHIIMAPDSIEEEIPVLISSQDAQAEIAEYIEKNHVNQIIRLY